MGCVQSRSAESPVTAAESLQPTLLVVEQPGGSSASNEKVLSSARALVDPPPNLCAQPPGSAVQQPHVLVEQVLAIIGSTRADLHRSLRDLPLTFELGLTRASLLTEVEVVWSQSTKCELRFELLLDNSTTAVQCSVIQDGELGEKSGNKPSRCRLQLDEPPASTSVIALRILTRCKPSDGAGSIHIREVIPRGLPVGSAPPRRRLLRPPKYWATTEGSAHSRIDVNEACHIAVFQQLLDETWKGRATRDRTGALPKRLLIKKVQRIEAPGLWNRFSRHRRVMSLSAKKSAAGCCMPLETLRGGGELAPVKTKSICEAAPEVLGPCDAAINEHYLFHGTSPAGALGIIREGFDLCRARPGAALLFGSGAYFAEASSKFDEYASADEFSGMCAVLVCRVLCGEMYHALRKVDPEFVSDPAFREKYNGILGDREASVGTYREFVVFRQEQIYPEYAVFYDREYGSCGE